jgi:spore coat protein U-like protein
MKIVIPVIALSALIASSVSAWSGSPSTNNLQIKMTIDKGCTVNPGGDAVLDFGTIGLVTGNIDIEGALTIQCTKGVDYTIGLGSGSNEGEKKSSRRMKNDKGDYIAYQLFSRATRNEKWASYSVPMNPPKIPKSDPSYPSVSQLLRDKTSLDNGALAGGKADGAVTSVPVYGRIEATDVASAASGTYTDTVTVEVRF